MSNKLVLKNNSLVLYIKQIMNVFIRAIVRIFSFGESLIVPFNSAIASLDRTINLSPHENILTIALINIHYLYNMKHRESHRFLARIWMRAFHLEHFLHYS